MGNAINRHGGHGWCCGLWSGQGLFCVFGTMSLFHAAVLMLMLLIPSQKAAASLPATEFVVPSGPVITLQDGQRIEGHIIEFDQTNVIIQTKEGTEQTLPRATIDTVRFQTLSGMEIAGALIGWKPGVYELTTEDAVVTVYSTIPLPPAKDSQPEEIVEAAAQAQAGDIEDINGAAVPSGAAGGPETQIAAVTPLADIEISVSTKNAVENGAPVAFDIVLSKPSEDSVVLIYATIDGTAIDGEDYKAARGVLVIKSGETSARIEAEVINDDLREDKEDLRLFLTVDPSVAVVKNRQIVATIEDDDQG